MCLALQRLAITFDQPVQSQGASAAFSEHHIASVCGIRQADNQSAPVSAAGSDGGDEPTSV